MEKRQLGKSSLYVSALALGCWAMAGGEGWGEQDEQESVATVHAALDHGINFFDTAEAYGSGKSEEVLGKALRRRREQAIVATKISPGHASAAELRPHLEASLCRLQTDYVDLYIIHWPPQTSMIVETLMAMDALRQEGKIRAVGISNFGVENLAAAQAASVDVAANQLCYNLLSRAIEFKVLPLCRQNGISVTAYMPLMQGILSGKWLTIDDIPPFRTRTRHFSGSRPGARHGEAGAEVEVNTALQGIREVAADLGRPMADVALAWVAAREGVASILAGGRTPEQVARNAQAMELELTDEIIERLDVATKAVKERLGKNIDYWQGKEQARSG